jgi:hypothetical protein
VSGSAQGVFFLLIVLVILIVIVFVESPFSEIGENGDYDYE